MMNSLYAAVTGMSTQQTQMDIIANNLSNVNTTGYKAQTIAFEDLFYQQVGSRQAARVGSQVGMGSAPTRTGRDLTQGTLTDTGKLSNIAIEGAGYFQIDIGGQQAFTRAGDFQIDANGQLVTTSGYFLIPNIFVPAGTEDSLSIGPAGDVTVMVSGTIQNIGQIQIATFANPEGLEAIGGNAYRATVNSGTPVATQPGLNGAGRLVQGFVESSNVSVMTEMVNMISAQRAFESVARVISASDEMLGMANAMRR